MAISRMNMERQLRNMGGIMTLDEPRQGYFLGKIVKKAKRAVKKVVKSPLGKLAIGAAAANFAPLLFGKGTLLSQARNAGGILNLLKGSSFGKGLTSGEGFLGSIGNVFRVGGDPEKGISGLRVLGGLAGAGAIAAPFFMGEEEPEEPEESFAGPISSIESIRQQARDYYQDPTKSALYFMPQKQFVRPFAGGGLADIPRGGYSNGGDVFSLVELSKLKKLGFDVASRGVEPFGGVKVLKDILRVNRAEGGLADIPREGYRIGGGVMSMLGKAKDMVKAGVGKVKSLFDDADINISVRDEDVLTDAGLQAQAVGNDVFITAKSKRATRVLDDLIDAGYDISKDADNNYSINALDEGALDIIAKRLKLGDKNVDEFMQGLPKYVDEMGAEEEMIYDALRQRRADGGIMDLGGMEKDYREGGFVPIGAEERADDVPARLSKNEFVFTADAVRNAGGGDIDKGAEVMQNMMDNLEAGGMISEESQGKENPAQAMFDQAQMLESRIV